MRTLAGTLLLATALADQPSIEPGPYHPAVSNLVASLLDYQHYEPQRFDDALSSRWLERYLDALDFNHMIFLASDIEEFDRFRDVMDDDVLRRRPSLEAATAIYARYQERFAERIEGAHDGGPMGPALHPPTDEDRGRRLPGKGLRHLPHDVERHVGGGSIVVQLAAHDEPAVVVEVLAELVGIGGEAVRLDEQAADAEGQVEAELEGDPVTIAFNARYMVEALQNMEAEQLAVELSGPLAPGVLKPVDDPAYVHVIMPVRTPS